MSDETLPLDHLNNVQAYRQGVLQKGDVASTLAVARMVRLRQFLSLLFLKPLLKLHGIVVRAQPHGVISTTISEKPEQAGIHHLSKQCKLTKRELMDCLDVGFHLLTSPTRSHF